jgi:hypothetical protein
MGKFIFHLDSSFTKNSKRYVKEGSGKRASSLYKGLPKGNLEGGLLCWRLKETCQERLWDYIYLSLSLSVQGLHKGNLKVFSKGELTQYV